MERKCNRKDSQKVTYKKWGNPSKTGRTRLNGVAKEAQKCTRMNVNKNKKGCRKIKTVKNERTRMNKNVQRCTKMYKNVQNERTRMYKDVQKCM